MTGYGLRCVPGSRLLCTFAKSKGTPEDANDDNSMAQSDDVLDEDILAADSEDAWDDEELAPDETRDQDGDYDTTEVLSGEELELRKADESTVDDDDESDRWLNRHDRACVGPDCGRSHPDDQHIHPSAPRKPLSSGGRWRRPALSPCPS